MDRKKERKISVKLPGMRVIKTVLAVYLCFLINFIRDGIPFYSAIAAILCMQTDYSNSYKAGKSRTIGTFIGGVYGFLAIVFINFIGIELFTPLHFLILSLFLIPIIYTSVYLKTPSASYISCVVFLSITVAHGGDSKPVIFAINRVVDTLIGIGVSLGVNKIL